MGESVLLARVIQGELPFTLNLPEGTYPVLADEGAYPIDIWQNRLAVADGPEMMRIGTAEELRPVFGDRPPPRTHARIWPPNVLIRVP